MATALPSGVHGADESAATDSVKTLICLVALFAWTWQLGASNVAGLLDYFIFIFLRLDFTRSKIYTNIECLPIPYLGRYLLVNEYRIPCI